LLGQAAVLLKKIFAGQELAAPFLDIDTLSGMLGTYELVNMCISIPHPLNTQNAQIAELLQGKALADLHALQKDIDAESDEEDEEDDEEDEADDKEAQAVDGQEAPKPGSEPPKDENVVSEEEQLAAALEAVKDGSLFAHVVGTSLCEALSYQNHSCLPNARIDFGTSATPESTSGPGLWVSAYARKPLCPGDEVQMCYVPSVVGRPVEERQKRMKRFGFECRCRCCTTDLMLKADGDIVLPRSVAGKTASKPLCTPVR
jgi:hypothetical protein